MPTAVSSSVSSSPPHRFDDTIRSGSASRRMPFTISSASGRYAIHSVITVRWILRPPSRPRPKAASAITGAAIRCARAEALSTAIASPSSDASTSSPIRRYPRTQTPHDSPPTAASRCRHSHTRHISVTGYCPTISRRMLTRTTSQFASFTAHVIRPFPSA